MRHWLIGRNRAACELVLPEGESGVSRVHAEVCLADDGRFYLTDRASTNGTRMLEESGWEEVRQGFVHPDQRVRFGDFETSLAKLFRRAGIDPAARRREAPPSTAGTAPGRNLPSGVQVMRDEYGNIVPRKP